MKLNDCVEQLGLAVKSYDQGLDRELGGVYVSDLLSDVMANGVKDAVWITLQTHMNIVAVAGLKELAGIIIVNNRTVPDEVLKKAETEGVTILSTDLPTFDIAGRLYEIIKSK